MMRHQRYATTEIYRDGGPETNRESGECGDTDLKAAACGENTPNHRVGELKVLHVVFPPHVINTPYRNNVTHWSLPCGRP